MIRVRTPCPEDPDCDEEIEWEVEAELGYNGRTGLHNPPSPGERLPCGHVLDSASAEIAFDMIVEVLEFSTADE